MANATLNTTNQKAIREDLGGFISNISRAMTPFKSSIGTAKATQTFHQWNLDELKAPASNKVAEGADFTDPSAPDLIDTVGNYTQISSAKIKVSGSLEAADKAGRKSEFKYQSSKRGKELMRDIEFDLVGTQVRAPGATRAAGGYMSFAGASVGAGAAARTVTQGSKDGTVVGSAAGTDVAFTLADVNEVMETVNGTTTADAGTMMMSNANKGKFSDLVNVGTGTNVRRNIDEKGKLKQSVDIYETDFGIVKLVPNYIMTDDNVFIYDSSMIKFVTYRPVHYRDIREAGDSMRALMVTEWSLQCDNYKGNGAIVGAV